MQNESEHSSELILCVEDPGSAAAFYERVLGVSLALDVPGMTEFDLGGATLGLMPLQNTLEFLPGVGSRSAALNSTCGGRTPTRSPPVWLRQVARYCSPSLGPGARTSGSPSMPTGTCWRSPEAPPTGMSAAGVSALRAGSRLARRLFAVPGEVPGAARARLPAPRQAPSVCRRLTRLRSGA